MGGHLPANIYVGVLSACEPLRPGSVANCCLLSVRLWIRACQAPLSRVFPAETEWVVAASFSGDLLDPGSNPSSLFLAVDSLPLAPPGVRSFVLPYPVTVEMLST